MDLTAPESLSALVCEVWFSEMARVAGLAPGLPAHPAYKPAELAGLLKGLRRAPGSPSLQSLASSEGGRFALFIALRLLAEVFELDMLRPAPGGFDIAPRPPFPAAAVRHWYSTAVRSVQDDEGMSQVPMRLPGRYATRGDWYMAVARGSQSLRVAYDALDILCSSRGNFDRLQRGIGLPVRKMPEEDHIRTALATVSGPRGVPSMTYKNFRGLGANDCDFHWLFRSHLSKYHYHSTVFRKWCFRVLTEYSAKRSGWSSGWINAFEAYDGVMTTRQPQPRFMDEYAKFCTDHAPRLVALLQDAEP